MNGNQRLEYGRNGKITVKRLKSVRSKYIHFYCLFHSVMNIVIHSTSYILECTECMSNVLTK